MLHKVTGEAYCGLQPTHPTQSVDLTKRIPIKITHLIPATRKQLKKKKTLKLFLPE